MHVVLHDPHNSSEVTPTPGGQAFTTLVLTTLVLTTLVLTTLVLTTLVLTTHPYTCPSFTGRA